MAQAQPDPIRKDQRTAVKEITEELEARLSDPACRWHNNLADFGATLEAAFPQFYSEDPAINKHVKGIVARKAALKKEKEREREPDDEDGLE